MALQKHYRKTSHPEKNRPLWFLISILSLVKDSNLFRIELIFRSAKISLLRLSLRIFCELEFVLDFAFSRVSDKQSVTVTKL